MTFVALTCPQCAAPLPRAAYWRTVTCSYCGTSVSRTVQTVRRSDFAAALERSRAALPAAPRVLAVGGERYAIHALLADGEHARVHLARRIHPFGGWVTLKLARAAKGRDADALAREARTLDALQALRAAGTPYFSQRLPQVVALGLARFEGGTEADAAALVLRHPVGYWGSLHDAARLHAAALADPRHAVWIWRRALEVLGWLHEGGWTHRDLAAQHLLLHPRDHGVLLVGWSRAGAGGEPGADLAQLAWTMRMLLAAEPAASSAGDAPPPRSNPQVPAPLARLLADCEDAAWCGRTGARALHERVGRAAAEAFGPPRFVPLALG